MIRMLVILVPALAAACAPAPMSRERAEMLCREEAGLADGVQGRVGVGISSDGPGGRAGITVTNRVLDPQTEAEFLAECIARRMAGEPQPTTFGVNIDRRF